MGVPAAFDEFEAALDLPGETEGHTQTDERVALVLRAEPAASFRDREHPLEEPAGLLVLAKFGV